MDNAKLDPDRDRVLNAVVANLRLHYLDPALAEQMASSLLSHARNGDDRTAGQKLDSAIAKSEQRADQAKADIKDEMAKARESAAAAAILGPKSLADDARTADTRST